MAAEAERRPVAFGASRRSLLAYRILLVVIIAVGGALAVQSAASRLLTRRAPELALQISPGDAIASSRRASVLMTQGLRDPAQLRLARQYAEQALRRDLTRDEALVVLAATITGATADQRARRLVAHAESLSRRNLVTQLWLIEDSVRQDSAGGALRHFDVALRTTENAGGVLYPVLRDAVEDPQLTADIARTVNAAPWRGQFLQYAVSLNRPTPALAQVFATQRKLSPFQGTDLKGALIAQLVASRFYDAAAQLALGKNAGLVQDPQFATNSGYAPFSWQLADANGLVARRIREGNTTSLQVQADEATAGVAASQLIHAPPGAYILTAAVAAGEPGLVARVQCAKDDRELATLPIRARTAITVNVPPACPYQTLSVIVSPRDGAAGEWRLARIDITPNRN